MNVYFEFNLFYCKINSCAQAQASVGNLPLIDIKFWTHMTIF